MRALWRHLEHGQGWRDVTILVMGVLLVWKLISESIEPNLVLAERIQKESIAAQATSTGARVGSLQTQVAILATPTPVRSNACYYPICEGP